MAESDYVFIEGQAITIGEHGQHSYLFESGNSVYDDGESSFVFESGTGLSGSLVAIELIDDFEDGDLVTKSPDWDGWEVINTPVTFENTTEADLEGTRAAKVTNNGAATSIKTSVSDGENIEPITTIIQVQFMDQTGDGGGRYFLRFTEEGGGQTDVIIYFEMDGTVRVDDPDSTIYGNWQAGEPYEVRINWEFAGPDDYIDLTVENLNTGFQPVNEQDISIGNMGNIQDVEAIFDGSDSGPITGYFDYVNFRY